MFKKSKSGIFNSELSSLILLVIITFAIRIFVMEIFFIPSGSMKMNLLEGDYIFSTKYSYGYSKYTLPIHLDFFKGKIFAKAPERGDIIIMYPAKNTNERWVKRLIGLPGDKIQIIDNILHINDVPVSRKQEGTVQDLKGQSYLKFKEVLPNGVSYYSYKKGNGENLVNMDFKNNSLTYYVPENKYFFLGDNRDESNDSRFDLGFVPAENLIAKARFIIFSFKETLIWKILDMPHNNPWSWLKSIRLSRMFTGV